MTQEHDKSSCR